MVLEQAIHLLEDSGCIKASAVREQSHPMLSYLELQAVKLRAFQKMLLWDALVQYHGSKYGVRRG